MKLESPTTIVKQYFKNEIQMNKLMNLINLQHIHKQRRFLVELIFDKISVSST